MKLSESERGFLLSGMSDGSIAGMVGRSTAWVARARRALKDQAEPVQARAAIAVEPWVPEGEREACLPTPPLPEAHSGGRRSEGSAFSTRPRQTRSPKPEARSPKPEARECVRWG